MSTGIKESNHFLLQAMKVLYPAYERGNFGEKLGRKKQFAEHSGHSGNSGHSAVFYGVVVEVMREARRIAESRIVPSRVNYDKSDLMEQDEDADAMVLEIWELAFVTASVLVDTEAVTADKKRLLAEAQMVRGLSIFYGLLQLTPKVDLTKRIEVASTSFLAAIEDGQKSDPHSSDMWMDMFQKLTDTLGDANVNDTALFAHICNAYSISLLEAQSQSTDAARGKAKTGGNAKDGASALKMAEEALKNGLSAKNADYNSLFANARSWCRLQAQRTPAASASNIETEDPVVRLFASIEIAQQAGVSGGGGSTGAKSSKDSEISTIEHSVALLRQIKFIPDVFRIELFLRIGKQAFELNQTGIAFGCAWRAQNYLKNIEAAQIDKSDYLNQWLVTSRLLSTQLMLSCTRQMQRNSRHLKAAMTMLMTLLTCCIKTPLSNPTILRLCLRHIWSTVNPYLTKQQFSMVLKDIMSILKQIAVAYNQDKRFRNQFDMLDDADIVILQDLFCVTIDILIDDNKLMVALRLSDYGLRVLVKRKQSEIWFRKALILNMLGKGSSLVPLKDDSIEVQAMTWKTLATALTSVDKKMEAFQIALKLLSSKHLTNTWTARVIQSEYDRWLVTSGCASPKDTTSFNIAAAAAFESASTAGLGTVSGSTVATTVMTSAVDVASQTGGDRPVTAPSNPRTPADPNSIDDIFMRIKEQLLFAQYIVDKEERSACIYAARHAAESLITQLLLYARPPVEQSEKDAAAATNAGTAATAGSGTAAAPSGAKSAAKLRKPKEPQVVQEAVEIPSAETWHLFTMPPTQRSMYMQSTHFNHINKHNVKDPLGVCSSLLGIVLELVRLHDLQSTHPIFCLLELIAELSCPENPDLLSSIQLYFSVILSMQGLEKRASEKYKLVMLRSAGTHEDGQLALTIRQSSVDESVMFRYMYDIFLFKAECYMYFGDYTEAQKLVSQSSSAITESEFQI
eukprot:jgi/Hompol1/6723/HPOL_005056-RA